MKIIIEMETEKSANFFKKELEEKYPLLDGRIKLYENPQITTLDKVIEANKQEYKQRRS